MSRIGKRPVTVPAGVTLTVAGSTITVKGPKGELKRTLSPELGYKLEGTEFTVTRPSESEKHKALHGLSRTLVANMVEGVTKGYQKVLEIQGVGYKAEMKPFGVNLIVGYSHQVPYKGKGIRYVGEQVRRKAGKTAQAAK